MNIRNYTILFFFINLLLSSYYLDIWRNPNSTSRVLQIACLSEEGVLNIDKHEDQTIDKAFVNGHFYPLQPPLPALVVFPFYEVGQAFGVIPEYATNRGNSIFLLGAFLMGSLPFTLLITILFLHLLKSGMKPEKALLISMIPMYGSMFFIYTGVFYSHVFVALMLVLSYQFISTSKHLFYAGLLSGAAFFSEYLTAVIFAVWFFQIWYNSDWKKAFSYAAGLIPFILLFMGYNYTATGNPLLTVYSFNTSYDMTNVGFTFPNPYSILLMLFSPWRGAFIFVPILWSVFAGINWRNRMGFKALLSHYIWLPVVIFVLTLSSYQEWHGGWTFGPRYLIPAIILIIIGFSSKIQLDSYRKYWFWIPVIFGLGYSLLAKFTVMYSIPSESRFPLIQTLLPKLKEGSINDGNFISRYFSIEPGLASLIWMLLFGSMIYLLYQRAQKVFAEK